MVYKDFIPANNAFHLKSGEVTWRSPSNIALIKYWGKREAQIPANASISFTLDNCFTTTKLTYKPLKNLSDKFSFELKFEGAPKPSFHSKIEQFLERIEPYLPFLKSYHLSIETSNSFPHSSGIASSASGMSALALCLMSMEEQLMNSTRSSKAYFLKKASFLARLGSGSACRSIEGEIAVWGKHTEIEGSSDIYGITYPYKIHDNFKNYQDTILLIDQGEKQVSSTVGHGLMHGHAFAKKRFDQAAGNMHKIISILERGSLPEFIQLVESEALVLHAMMMTSIPYFILMKPNTLEVINRIWSFRKETGANLCFTLDAGANVHVLYPEREKTKILQFIKNELVAYCQNGQYICDQIGFGAKKL